MKKDENTPKGGAGKKNPPEKTSPDSAPDAVPDTIPAAEPVNLLPANNPEDVQQQYIAKTVIRFQGKEYQPGDILPETADGKTIDELLALSAIG